MVAPRPLALISRMTSLSVACGRTAGAASPARITSATVVSSLRPSEPPGCDRAKSSVRKPRASSKATASASPRAICTVVLAVGARLSGQASFSTPLLSTIDACCAKLDCGLPVMAISATPWRLSTGSTRASSSLSPLLLIASTTSAVVTMPRSPCPASAGCTKKAGVPVEASVAAILRPTWPLFPMPMTTTRPGAESMALMACASALAAAGCWNCVAACCRAAASMAKVSCTSCRARGAFEAKAFMGEIVPMPLPAHVRCGFSRPGWCGRQK